MMADAVQHIPKTELARNTRQVINSVLRGRPAVVESYGEPEVAIIDVVDYYIVRAVVRYYSHQAEIDPEIDPEAGLADQQVEPVSDPQARYNLVLSHYLAEAISLGRAAELLGLSRFDLQTRCLRLDVPLRMGPANLEQARADIEAARE
jgi:predicted HTH domain antitoxin